MSGGRITTLMCGAALMAMASCGAVDNTFAGISRTFGSGSGAPITIESPVKRVSMSPEFTTRVFDHEDINTATIFLSDLSLDELTAALERGGAGVSGNLLHIHMFLLPKAGETPVAFTAANATVRHYVIADGAVGVYSGGGFLLPTGGVTGEAFSARLGGATLRLADQRGPFIDRLEGSEVEGGVNAARDERAVTAIASRLLLLMDE